MRDSPVLLVLLCPARAMPDIHSYRTLFSRLSPSPSFTHEVKNTLVWEPIQSRYAMSTVLHGGHIWPPKTQQRLAMRLLFWKAFCNCQVHCLAFEVLAQSTDFSVMNLMPVSSVSWCDPVLWNMPWAIVKQCMQWVTLIEHFKWVTGLLLYSKKVGTALHFSWIRCIFYSTESLPFLDIAKKMGLGI